MVTHNLTIRQYSLLQELIRKINVTYNINRKAIYMFLNVYLSYYQISKVCDVRDQTIYSAFKSGANKQTTEQFNMLIIEYIPDLEFILSQKM